MIVVGAGPAGAFAAREVARNGARVLLLDRQQFPRPKVCGGCLNRRTLSFLEAAGLGGLPAALGGQPIHEFALWTGGAPAQVSTPPGIAVSRTVLDAALVAAAVEAGADFLPGARATLGEAGSEHRSVGLPEESCRLEARLVVAADGLGGSLLGGRAAKHSRTARGSRLGAGAIVDDPSGAYAPGVIHMAVGRAGYAGVVKVEDDRLCVAAALDRRAVREEGLGPAVDGLLERSGMPPIEAAARYWRGTPELTRRASTVALERVFLIGDAAGYVEPFTGEGISWALETARDVSQLAREALGEWRPDLEQRWRRLYRQRIARRQRWCRVVALALRQPSLVRWGAGWMRRKPGLATPLMAHLNSVPAAAVQPAKPAGDETWA